MERVEGRGATCRLEGAQGNQKSTLSLSPEPASTTVPNNAQHTSYSTGQRPQENDRLRGSRLRKARGPGGPSQGLASWSKELWAPS